MDGRRGQSQMHREAKTPLLLLFGITGIVLLIACANVANLLLARGAARATEMGVRLALGATRRHLLTQLMTESLLLALAGGVASLLVAQWTLAGIGAMMPPEANDTFTLTLRPAVVGFTAALSIATGFVFGMFPALHSTRADLITAIRAGAGQIAGGQVAARFRNGLVTVQIALAMSLLISSGLFLRSLANVSRVDLGVKLDDMVTFSIGPDRAGYDSVRARALFRQVSEALRAVPGVTAVTEAEVPLLAGESWGNNVRAQGFPEGPDIDRNSRFNAVGPGYFAALGVHLLGGREFTEQDELGASKVVVVNEAFVRKFRLGPDVVGKFMTTNDTGALNAQIVGLVPDVKYNNVKDSIPPVFYVPLRQERRVGNVHFYARTALGGESLLGTVRAVMSRIAPLVPVEDLRTMPEQARTTIFLDRMISILTSSFAILATLLAAVGLYGVLAYSVTQRTREIGVRMALGADGGAVRRLVLRQVLGMLAIGGTIGLVAALGLGAAARALLYGVSAQDPVVFGASAVLLALIAIGAGWIPARRASLVNPMQALRYD
ncbi:MAG: FtsX-like permease family protein [Gemmatimonadetes bacterium]|nr:FtsX-like permease family protein [Gemmatimonadota bacterium]